MNLVLVRAGIRTADALLATFYGLAPLEKAGPDPLTRRGFDKMVLGVLRELRAGVAGKEKKAIEALLRELEKDWSKLGEAAKDVAFRAAAEKYLGFGPDVGAAVGQVARHVGPTIIAGTKAAAVHRDRLRIEPSLNAVDERMVVAAATHQALFARDEHGRRSVWLADRARAVVSQGLEEGLDRYEIAKRIRSDLGAAADVRSENYWRLIASVFTGRARSYGHLSAMGEAGVEEFEFEAVLDEVTTEICRFMHGKTFSTGAGLARFAEVEQAQDPEEVKNLQPWAGTGKTPDGGLALFYKTDAGRRMVAQVDEPAAGKKDAVGKYSKALSNKMLEKVGMTTPPLHGHCRSTTLPVLGAVQILPGAPIPEGQRPADAQPRPPVRPQKPRVTTPAADEGPVTVAPAEPQPGYRLPMTPERLTRIASDAATAMDLVRGKNSEAGDGAREAVQEILLAGGLTPRPGSRVLRSATRRSLGGADGARSFGTGDVELTKPVFEQARKVLHTLASDPKAFEGKLPGTVGFNTQGLRVLIHEEVHGASRCTAAAYVGVGVGMEEAATEILARKLTRELLGYKLTGASDALAVPYGLPVRGTDGKYSHTATGGAYHGFVEGLFSATAEVAGDDGIHERVEKALLATRAGSPKDPPWTKPEDQVRAYVDALALPKVDGDKLFVALTGPKSPFRGRP